jgi:hypothetical protein
MCAAKSYFELCSRIEKFPFIDEIRLELADLLDQQDNLRGRLIREQCSTDPDPACIKQMLDRHGRSWAAQDLGVPDHIIPSGASFEFHKGFAWWPVHTSYNSFSAAIAAGRYDYVDPRLIAANLRIKDAPVTINAQLVLYASSRNITSEAAVWNMRRRLGLHVEQDQIWELFAFGEKYPDVQRHLLCVALGSVDVYPNGLRGVPCLGRWNTGRKLDLYFWDGEWLPDCCFLAVRQLLFASGTLVP